MCSNANLVGLMMLGFSTHLYPGEDEVTKIIDALLITSDCASCALCKGPRNTERKIAVSLDRYFTYMQCGQIHAKKVVHKKE